METKSAKEMFEELGYELDVFQHYQIEYKRHTFGYFYEAIMFSKEHKTFYKCYWNDIIAGSVIGDNCDMNELKAINQQCKELGWLND